MPILDFFHKRVTDSQGRYLLTLTISVTRLTNHRWRNGPRCLRPLRRRPGGEIRLAEASLVLGRQQG